MSRASEFRSNLNIFLSLLQPYKQIIPDYRYDELEEAERKKRGGHSNSGKVAPTQVCIQFPVVPGKSQTDSPGKDTTTEKSSPQKADESGAKDQSQPGGTVSSPVMKINRLLLFLLVNVLNLPPAYEFDGERGFSTGPGGVRFTYRCTLLRFQASCLPAGCGGCPQPVKMMLCLPCPPPDCAASSSAGAAASTPCNKNKPVRTVRWCESWKRDKILILGEGGFFVFDRKTTRTGVNLGSYGEEISTSAVSATNETVCNTTVQGRPARDDRRVLRNPGRTAGPAVDATASTTPGRKASNVSTHAENRGSTRKSANLQVVPKPIAVETWWS